LSCHDKTFQVELQKPYRCWLSCHYFSCVVEGLVALYKIRIIKMNWSYSAFVQMIWRSGRLSNAL